jgi:hypothetical protein
VEREFDLDQGSFSPIAFLWLGLLCGNSNVPHPLPDIGNGSHGLHLVKLPSRRVFSDQAGVSECGEGRSFTSAADHHIAQRIC